MINRYTLGLAILAVGLVVLLATSSSGSVLGMSSGQFASVVSLVALLVFIGSRAMVAAGGWGGAARGALLWLAILVGLVAIYQYRPELGDFAARVGAGFLPGRAQTGLSADGRATVAIGRAASGAFEAGILVDGKPVRAIVDTGASNILLSHEDARRAGIDVDRLSYTLDVMTAGGPTRVAVATAGEVRIGAIVRRNVKILVAGADGFGESLLGMNFIDTLSGFELRGDRMVLTD